MGALLSLPFIGTFIYTAATFGEVVADVYLMGGEIVTYGCSAAANLGGSGGGTAILLASIGGAFNGAFNAFSAFGSTIKREESHGHIRDAYIKFHFTPDDPGHTAPLRVSTFEMKGVNNDTGIAHFVWSNTTEQAYGGRMTDVWLNPDGTLKFPDPCLAKDACLNLFPWYPNGTLTGEDVTGAPITGNWTTKLNHWDVKFFNNLTAKKEALDRSQKMQAEMGVKRSCMHVDYGSRSRRLFHGPDTCEGGKQLSERATTRLHKRAEKAAGYEGDEALLNALKAALLAK